MADKLQDLHIGLSVFSETCFNGNGSTSFWTPKKNTIPEIYLVLAIGSSWSEGQETLIALKAHRLLNVSGVFQRLVIFEVHVQTQTYPHRSKLSHLQLSATMNPDAKPPRSILTKFIGKRAQLIGYRIIILRVFSISVNSY